MREDAFYQTLGRLCRSNEIMRIAKGVYCKPKISKFGIIPPTDNQLLEAFTENNQGVAVGYALYNSLKLTTQIAKRITVYSAVPDEQQKTVGNLFLKRVPMQYSGPVQSMVQMMDVLQHYQEIQEIKPVEFVKLCKKFATGYEDRTADYVFRNIKYPKWTVAFLKAVLDHEKKPNELDRYLSSLSAYHIPDVEVLYESAQV